MELNIYINDDKIQLKYNNKIIEKNNYLFSTKKIINNGRIIDYDLFIDYIESIMISNKIKRNNINFLCGLTNKKIDLLLIKEMLDKLGFKKIKIIKISKILKDFLNMKNGIVIVKYSKISEIYHFKNNRIFKSYILPNNYLNYIKEKPIYVIGKITNKNNIYYEIENYNTFLINQI